MLNTCELAKYLAIAIVETETKYIVGAHSILASLCIQLCGCEITVIVNHIFQLTSKSVLWFCYLLNNCITIPLEYFIVLYTQLAGSFLQR